MTNIHSLIIEQFKTYTKIVNCYSNYEKNYKNNFNLGSLEARLIQLETNWKKCQDFDQKIINLKTEEDESQPYFKDIKFSLDNIEEKYYDEYGKLLQKKLNIQSHVAAPTPREPVTAAIPRDNSLPKMDLPSSDGDLKQWIGFQNLFNDLVVKSNKTTS